MGWEINHNQDGIKISQQRYIEQLLGRHGLQEANGAWNTFPESAESNSAQMYPWKRRNTQEIVQISEIFSIGQTDRGLKFC